MAIDTAQSPHHGKPLKIEVISTDWQWLFVYPQLDIAASNRLVVPTDRKVELRLTAVDITNDFYVLKVINQMYVMPGMRTRHNFYLDRPGEYRGFSTEFSGPGFAWMNYKMKAISSDDFKHWVAKAKAAPQRMTWAHFKRYARPTVNTGDKWTLYSHVAPNLFSRVISQVRSGKLAYKRPMRFSDEMDSSIFEKHSTGDSKRGNN